MSKEADDAVLVALQQHHGTIILNNPSKALIAVGKENTELHEEMDRCHRELDIYRNALTVIAYLSWVEVGSVDSAFGKCQTLAKAALSQLMMGSSDLSLLRQAQATQGKTDVRN